MSLISTFNETPLNEAYLAREIVQISGANTLRAYQDIEKKWTTITLISLCKALILLEAYNP